MWSFVVAAVLFVCFFCWRDSSRSPNWLSMPIFRSTGKAEGGKEDEEKFNFDKFLQNFIIRNGLSNNFNYSIHMCLWFMVSDFFSLWMGEGTRKWGSIIFSMFRGSAPSPWAEARPWRDLWVLFTLCRSLYFILKAAVSHWMMLRRENSIIDLLS